MNELDAAEPAATGFDAFDELAPPAGLSDEGRQRLKEPDVSFDKR